jgi:hypothetical protein
MKTYLTPMYFLWGALISSELLAWYFNGFNPIAIFALIGTLSAIVICLISEICRLNEYIENYEKSKTNVI